MSEISKNIGKHIRNFRNMQGLTLMHLAEMIHKSRATLSKYENGEITIDIETLYEIASALNIDIHRLLDSADEQSIPPITTDQKIRSPFYQANRLYFYFYDGRYKRLKDGIINIRKNEGRSEHEATLSISSVTPTGRSSESYYTGKVVYSDMLIRFSFVNQYNTLEEDLLYIFNPFELRDFTEGLLCGISSADLMPCAFRCIVSLTPKEMTEELNKRLMFSSKDLKRWQKLNMMIVDNRS